MNSSPDLIDHFAQIPIRVVNGVPVLIGDVGRVTDGFADQTNVVRVDGKRATYMAILKQWGIQAGAITNPTINGAVS